MASPAEQVIAVEMPEGEMPPDVVEVEQNSFRYRNLRNSSLASRVAGLILGCCGILVGMAAWDLLRTVGLFPSKYVPSVQAIFQGLYDGFASGQLGPALAHTMAAWAGGLAIAVLIAIPIGMLVGTRDRWERSAGLLTSLLRPLPPPALLPVAILFAGLSLHMELMLVAFASFWPLYFNTSYGARGVEPLLNDTGRVLRYTPTEQLVHVTFPASLPSTATGLRLAALTALTVSVSVELIAGSGGLGSVVELAQSGANITLSYSGILLAGIIGWCMNTSLLSLERKIHRWAF